MKNEIWPEWYLLIWSTSNQEELVGRLTFGRATHAYVHGMNVINTPLHSCLASFRAQRGAQIVFLAFSGMAWESLIHAEINDWNGMIPRKNNLIENLRQRKSQEGREREGERAAHRPFQCSLWTPKSTNMNIGKMYLLTKKTQTLVVGCQVRNGPILVLFLVELKYPGLVSLQLKKWSCNLILPMREIKLSHKNICPPSRIKKPMKRAINVTIINPGLTEMEMLLESHSL